MSVKVTCSMRIDERFCISLMKVGVYPKTCTWFIVSIVWQPWLITALTLLRFLICGAAMTFQCRLFGYLISYFRGNIENSKVKCTTLCIALLPKRTHSKGIWTTLCIGTVWHVWRVYCGDETRWNTTCKRCALLPTENVHMVTPKRCMTTIVGLCFADGLRSAQAVFFRSEAKKLIKLCQACMVNFHRRWNVVERNM